MIEFTYDYEIRAFGFVLSYEEKLIIKEYNISIKIIRSNFSQRKIIFSRAQSQDYYVIMTHVGIYY